MFSRRLITYQNQREPLSIHKQFKVCCYGGGGHLGEQSRKLQFTRRPILFAIDLFSQLSNRMIIHPQFNDHFDRILLDHHLEISMDRVIR